MKEITDELESMKSDLLKMSWEKVKVELFYVHQHLDCIYLKGQIEDAKEKIYELLSFLDRLI